MPEIAVNGDSQAETTAQDIAVIETPEPAPEPAPAPLLESPVPPPEEPAKAPEPEPRLVVLPGQCPECGKSFDNDRALSAHIRFKHDLPKARKAAAEKKAGRGSVAAPDPLPPDFSDITGAPAPSPVAVVPDARFEGMAVMTFDMSTQLLARIFGPEWLPNPDPDNPQVSHERMTMVAAIKKYYESVNLPDIPPGYMLCFVALAYAAPRMAAAPTKTKIQGAWLWLKTKFQKRRAAIPTIVK